MLEQTGEVAAVSPDRVRRSIPLVAQVVEERLEHRRERRRQHPRRRRVERRSGRSGGTGRVRALVRRLGAGGMRLPDERFRAGYAHPLWARFRKVAGDDPGSRALFAEMVADFDRFTRLEAVEADPEKAVAAYTAELKQRAEALERGIQEAQAAAGPRTGLIVPARCPRERSGTG